MKRIAMFVCLLVAGCNKPSEESCKKALLNMQHLLGTDKENKAGDLESEVRRCKGGSTKEAVECAAAAPTLDDLKKCDFYGTGNK